MNRKVILFFSISWILFLTALLLVGGADKNTMKERYHNLLELKFSQHPEFQTIESLLDFQVEPQPQLQMIKRMLMQLSGFNSRVHGMMRRPAPLYDRDMTFKKETDIQNLSHKITRLPGHCEAIGTSISATEDEYLQ